MFTFLASMDHYDQMLEFRRKSKWAMETYLKSKKKEKQEAKGEGEKNVKRKCRQEAKKSRYEKINFSCFIVLINFKLLLETSK